jgi:hypothetical protein
MRRLHKSSASRFEAEAIFFNWHRHEDSFDSDGNLSDHSADAAFIASQSSSAPSECHPQFALL